MSKPTIAQLKDFKQTQEYKLGLEDGRKKTVAEFATKFSPPFSKAYLGEQFGYDRRDVDYFINKFFPEYPKGGSK